MCKLLKSLYGLKQAPKEWHEKFERTLTVAGFVVNDGDKCVYYRHALLGKSLAVARVFGVSVARGPALLIRRYN